MPVTKYLLFISCLIYQNVTHSINTPLCMYIAHFLTFCDGLTCFNVNIVTHSSSLVRAIMYSGLQGCTQAFYFFYLDTFFFLDDSYDFPEPEPDYQDDDVMDAPTEKENTIDLLTHSLNEKVILRERKSSNSELDKRLSDPGNDELLIKPKKLANPCIASPARMAVHKELLLNYKMQVTILTFLKQIKF